MNRLLPALSLALLSAGVTACQGASKVGTQTGYRGTGMNNVYDHSEYVARRDSVAKLIPASRPPAGPPRAPLMPWRNVQVLKDVSTDEMTRTMISMAQWVAGSPQACAYCHNLAEMGDDTLPNGKPLYTKIVARRMLQMVRNINRQYEGHVRNTGVTCYTCHLGKPIPNGIWFAQGQHQLERYFLDVNGVRVQTHVMRPVADNRSSVKQTEWTYALMIRISSSLGVSCNHCHNSRAFTVWGDAPPKRVQALLGAEMMRDLNQNYMTPLTNVFPAVRKGPNGDVAKMQCITCHNGAFRPLYGYPMAKDYPALWGRPSWNGVPFPAIPVAGAAPAAGATGTAPAAPKAGASMSEMR